MSNTYKAETVWAVRGIPEEVRRAVVGRAKSEGRTVGSWVSEALRHALDSQKSDAMAEQLAELRRRIETLEERRPADTGEPRAPRHGG